MFEIYLERELLACRRALLTIPMSSGAWWRVHDRYERCRIVLRKRYGAEYGAAVRGELLTRWTLHNQARSV